MAVPSIAARCDRPQVTFHPDLAPARGILHGALFGALLWAVVLGVWFAALRGAS